MLLALSDMYPKAPIYTAFWRPGEAWERFKGKDIRVSWAHHIPGFSTVLHSPLRFLAPLIWKSFNFSSYDIVISSASWYITKGFGTRGTRNVQPVEFCYCHTPPRWLYGYPTSVEWQKYAIVRAYAHVVGFFMRQYDYHASQRVNFFIANSNNTARRIDKFYRREAFVIYPPIELPKVQNTTKKDYFLIASRLVGGKGLSLAVAAAQKYGFRLKIAGAPAGYAAVSHNLKRALPANIEFLGYVSDEKLARLYAEATAFLALADDEDFGMTPVEAMSMGTPVIAYRGGGYTETVLDKKTGVFIEDLTLEGVQDAICRCMSIPWSGKTLKTYARRFSSERFCRQFLHFVATHVQE